MHKCMFKYNCKSEKNYNSSWFNTKCCIPLAGWFTKFNNVPQQSVICKS